MDWLTPAVRTVTRLGSTTVLVPMVVVAGLVAWRTSRSWQRAALPAGALAGASLLYRVLQPWIARPRPTLSRLVATGSPYGFPSGHATQAAAALGALAWVLAARGGSRHRWAAVAARAAVVVIAVAIAVVCFSRVYLGAHWPTDVVAGWAVGWAWLSIVIRAVGSRPARSAPGPPSLPRS